MLDNIRYVHFNTMFRKWNGFTIAYSRKDKNILFAVALVKHTDKYDKSVGRLVSTQRLEMLAQDIDHRNTYFDEDNLIGNVTMNLALRTCCDLEIDSIFADQTLNHLNMTDFKHSFISSMLLEFVIENM